MPNFVFTKVLKFYNRNSRNLFNKFQGKKNATYPSTWSCFPTPGNLLNIYKSCCLVTLGIHLDTYNSNFLEY